STKTNFDRLINSLNPKEADKTNVDAKPRFNDPKNIKSQFVIMRKNIEDLIIPDPLYTRRPKK
ncbi:MAG: hypothetical protein V4581_02740, partial [Bacteroidota bacterium]